MLTRLVASVAGAILLVGGISAAGICLSHHAQWWSAWAAAMVIGTAAAVVSLVPVIPGLYAGTQYVAYGYLAGTVLRMLVTLAGGLAALVVARTPILPTAMILVPLYFAQLAAEAAVLSRAFWPRN